jgi:hypothetical protein
MMRSVAATLLFLTGTTAFAAPPEKTDEHEKSADVGDKMICKRFKETGSLVSSRRVCKTKRDWERERDALRTSSNINSCASQVGGTSC